MIAFEKYYKYIVVFLLLASFIRPVLANLEYPLLTSWDTWNFLSFSKLVYDNGGLPPNWDNLSLYPEGRPFLYPPLVATIIANLSLLTGVSIFSIIKLSTVFLYPILILLVFLLTLPFKDRKLSILTLVFLLSVNQIYVNSLNSLSQFTEIFLLIGTALLIYKKKYYWAILPFGLMFWTHAFTPLFFGAGLLLYAFYKKEERKDILKIVIGGLILGSPWLYRFFVFRDWIQPNLAMAEHFISSPLFYWRLFVEGWSFSIILLMSIFGILLNKPLIQKIKENRLLIILAAFSLGALPAYYYPERAITYMAPFFLPIAAFIFLNLSLDKLKKASLVILPLFFLLILYNFAPAEWLQTYRLTSGYLIFALFFIFSWVYFKIVKKAVFLLVLTIIFYFSPDEGGLALPFSTWLRPVLAGQNAPLEIMDACHWLKKYDPNAIFATDSIHFIGACQYLGLKSSEAPVVEFSKINGIWNHLGANYFISLYGEDKDDSDNDFPYLWQKGSVRISHLYSEDSVELQFGIKNPTDFPLVQFGFSDDIFISKTKRNLSIGQWISENEHHFLLDENSFRGREYQLSFSMDRQELILTDEKGKKYKFELNFIDETSSPYARGNHVAKFQIVFRDKNKIQEDKYLYQFDLFLTENNKFTFIDVPTSIFIPRGGETMIEQKIAPVFKMEGEYFR